MANELADVRARLVTQAAGVTGGGFTMNAARVVRGYDDFAGDANFYSALSGTGSATAGPYLIIRPGDISYDSKTQTSTFTIPCDLYLAITRGTDNTFANPESLLAAIKDAWAGNDFESELERPLDLNKNPIPVHYTITVTALGC